MSFFYFVFLLLKSLQNPDLHYLIPSNHSRARHCLITQIRTPVLKLHITDPDLHIFLICTMSIFHVTMQILLAFFLLLWYKYYAYSRKEYGHSVDCHKDISNRVTLIYCCSCCHEGSRPMIGRGLHGFFIPENT